MDSPPASPSPRPTTAPPPPRPDDPQLRSERRYPIRSTRADHRQASGPSPAASRYPVRSTRAPPPPTPRQRGRDLESAMRSPAPDPAPPSKSTAPAPPSPSTAPAPPSPSPARARARAPAPPSAATAPPSAAPLHPTRAYYLEEGKSIKIDIEELHTVVDTLGVSNDERKDIINNLLTKCESVYRLALSVETARCMPYLKAISTLEAQCDELSLVLGDSYVLTEEQKRYESLPELQERLTKALVNFVELKKQRLTNLQAMQLKLIDLWDALGVTLQDQNKYAHMMRPCDSLDQVKEVNALSTALLNEIQLEVERLEVQLMQKVTKHFAVLGGNLRQTHLSIGEEDYRINFTACDVKEGKTDMLTAHDKLKDLIRKSEVDIVQRAEVISIAEAYFRNKNYEGVNDLAERVRVWEEKKKREFIYDGEPLLTLLVAKTGNKFYPLSDAIAPLAIENRESFYCSGSSSDNSDKREPDHDPDFVHSESEEAAVDNGDCSGSSSEESDRSEHDEDLRAFNIR